MGILLLFKEEYRAQRGEVVMKKSKIRNVNSTTPSLRATHSVQKGNLATRSDLPPLGGRRAVKSPSCPSPIAFRGKYQKP